MTNYSCNNISLCFTLCLASNNVFSASFGNLEGNNVQDSATVCLSVGVWANLTGLDNFSLENTGIDGAAGTLYEGVESFHLESNHPVRVIVEGGILTDGENSIYTNYAIDGVNSQWNTAAEGPHSGDHQLTAKARLGRISDQKAGDYSGEVTLTVVPQVGGAGGCGGFTSGFATADGFATLAYEDLYPNLGDGDYNDMVIRYSVSENYNAKQELESVTLVFDPLASGAGYTHSFGLSLDGSVDKSKNVDTVTAPAFLGDALVTVNYSNGLNIDKTFSNIDVTDNIKIFPNSRDVLGSYANVYEGQEWVDAKFVTTVNITLADPSLNLWSDRGADALLSYRPFLHVNNTNSDIDLAVINPNDGMIASDGSPFGLFIPFDWQWPLERVNIETAYPDFADYKQVFTDIGQITEYAEQVFGTPADSNLVYTNQPAE